MGMLVSVLRAPLTAPYASALARLTRALAAGEAEEATWRATPTPYPNDHLVARAHASPLSAARALGEAVRLFGRGEAARAPLAPEAHLAPEGGARVPLAPEGHSADAPLAALRELCVRDTHSVVYALHRWFCALLEQEPVLERHIAETAGARLYAHYRAAVAAGTSTTAPSAVYGGSARASLLDAVGAAVAHVGRAEADCVLDPDAARLLLDAVSVADPHVRQYGAASAAEAEWHTALRVALGAAGVHGDGGIGAHQVLARAFEARRAARAGAPEAPQSTTGVAVLAALWHAARARSRLFSVDLGSGAAKCHTAGALARSPLAPSGALFRGLVCAYVCTANGCMLRAHVPLPRALGPRDTSARGATARVAPVPWLRNGLAVELATPDTVVDPVHPGARVMCRCSDAPIRTVHMVGRLLCITGAATRVASGPDAFFSLCGCGCGAMAEVCPVRSARVVSGGLVGAQCHVARAHATAAPWRHWTLVGVAEGNGVRPSRRV
jgi:hypothetical protein